MERVDVIMERLGFKKDSDEGTKAAFVKNLIKQAYGVEVPLPQQYEMPTHDQPPQTMEELNRQTLEGKPLPKKPVKAAVNALGAAAKESQLSFNFEGSSGDPTPIKAG